MRRADSLEKTLMLEGIRGRRRRRLPGASVRNPTRDKVMRQRYDGQGESDLRFSPWYFLSMYPKNPKSASLCTLLFHSPGTLWKKATQGFSLLHFERVFQSKNPTDDFLACLQDSYSCTRDCLRPPDRGRHRKLKTSWNVGASEESKSLE